MTLDEIEATADAYADGQMKHAPLVVLLPMGGHSGRVTLGGVDISRFIRRIEIIGDANDITVARIEYVGAVAVIAEPGRVELKQAEHLMVCESCRSVVNGERSDVAVVEVTAMQPDAEGAAMRHYAAVKS